ncbi:MAG TPA: L-histidine N(alpha)-methyltransferase [Bacillota bacterium]|nr:L-histidine N(alpha)-methyltransferase [Bacillota bacterium]
MLYFKNSELSDRYHVTLRTVQNWITAAKQQKLDLELHYVGNRAYVANTTRNVEIVEHLAQAGKKYRPKSAVKTAAPRPEFYEIFSTTQVLDIINNLDINGEIPRQYNYFAEGAEHWDAYARRLAGDSTPNSVNSTIKLLDLNRAYLNALFDGYQRVNIIDVGVGNAMPVRKLLAHLANQHKLGRYIALDISPEMLEIARRNIKAWFDGDVPFEGYEVDINYDRFANLVAEEHLKKSAEGTINVVLVLGGTLGNLGSPDAALKIIHDSMGRNDILIHSQKLDSERARRHFDFNVGPGELVPAPIHRFVVDLLNIDKSFYNLEVGYDEELRQRYERIRLKVALTIEFGLLGGEQVVTLNKDDTILLWRAWHQDSLDVMRQLDHNGFKPLQVSQTNDEVYVLTVSRLKTR